MPNPLCHFEFVTEDVERCKRFYGQVFNWAFGPSGIPDYTLIRTRRDPSGGIMNPTPEVPAPRFLAYFMVDDIPATLARITAAGGRTLKPETEVPFGSYALFADPDGNTLGLFRPK